MAHIKYLVTVDEATGATVKVERVGEAGELTEVAAFHTAAAPVAAPVVFNIYVGAGGAAIVPQQAPLGAAVMPSPGAAVMPSTGSAVMPSPGTPEKPRG